MKFTFPPESRPLAGYTLKRAIYRGGFGEVYYGLSDAGREVALKLLQHNTDVELRGVQQCLNLSHPNLVTIFDVRQDQDGDHWIIMEYVAGETLEAAIRRHPAGMPMEMVRKWLPGMAAGVGFLHRCGLVHRDLKPANIFIENDTIKVGDVGLTKFIAPSRHSAHTQSVGTVYYMAPEVAKGRYGKSVDIYAMGVILYEMLTGTLPFDGESTGEILMKHLTEQPDLSKLPPRLRAVIAQALHKNPQERYATPEELQLAFEAAVTGKVSPASTAAVESDSSCWWDQKAQRKDARWNSWETKRSRQPEKSLKPSVKHPWFGLMFALVIAGTVLIFRSGPAPHSYGRLLFLGISVAVAVMIIRSRRFHRENSTDVTERFAAPVEVVKASNPSSSGNRMTLGSACLSSLMVVPFVVLLTSLLAVFRPSLFTVATSTQIDPGMIGFFLAVSVLGCWGLLLVPALMSRIENRRNSRWSYVLAGSLVGLAAWMLNEYLFINLTAVEDWKTKAIVHQLGEHPLMLAATGPTLAGYVVFFTSLFAIRRWHHLTAPMRDQRFSVGTVFVTVLLTWMTTKVFEFPVPIALAWGAVIACSLQLASPWNNAPRPRFVDHSMGD